MLHTVIFIGLCLMVGYLCGCISTAYFVGKMHHIDIRKEGSGNLGSTNALRTLGVKAGLLTFLGDILKTLIPILVLRFVICAGHEEEGLFYALWLGLGTVLGHNFPFWLHFKGGKGIAVTAAVILALAHWQIMVIGLTVFVVIVFITRYVSLGSLIVAFYLPVNFLIWYQSSPYFYAMLGVSLVYTFLAFFQHRTNIVRLLHGNERKIGKKN